MASAALAPCLPRSGGADLLGLDSPESTEEVQVLLKGEVVPEGVVLGTIAQHLERLAHVGRDLETAHGHLGYKGDQENGSNLPE